MSSAVPGATATGAKPKTFDHPTWAVKKVSSVSELEEVRPCSPNRGWESSCAPGPPRVVAVVLDIFLLFL